jgi:hypothetical protein
VQATIRSLRGGPLTVRCGDRTITLPDLGARETIVLNAALERQNP